MIKGTAEQELRSFLLGLSCLAFLGAIVELLFIGHYEGFIQVIPFILSGIGLISIFLMWKSPGKMTVYALRYISFLIELGGLYGIYEHLSSNLAFEMEIHPEYALGTVFWEALGGATPLMAPGILFFAALLAMASTWKHPALVDQASE